MVFGPNNSLNFLILKKISCIINLERLKKKNHFMCLIGNLPKVTSETLTFDFRHIASVNMGTQQAAGDCPKLPTCLPRGDVFGLVRLLSNPTAKVRFTPLIFLPCLEIFLFSSTVL